MMMMNCSADKHDNVDKSSISKQQSNVIKNDDDNEPETVSKLTDNNNQPFSCSIYIEQFDSEPSLTEITEPQSTSLDNYHQYLTANSNQILCKNTNRLELHPPPDKYRSIIRDILGSHPSIESSLRSVSICSSDLSPNHSGSINPAESINYSTSTCCCETTALSGVALLDNTNYHHQPTIESIPQTGPVLPLFELVNEREELARLRQEQKHALKKKRKKRKSFLQRLNICDYVHRIFRYGFE